MENDPDMDGLFELIDGWRPTVPEWKRVQALLDEIRQRPAPKFDGTTIREVLQWSSENISIMRRCDDGSWTAAWQLSKATAQPTLYDCLYHAWITRNTKTT